MLKAGIYDPYLDTLGGGERYILTVAEILSQNGYQVDIFWSGNQDLLNKAALRFDLNLKNVSFVADIFQVKPSHIEEIDNPSSIKPYHLQTPNPNLILKLSNFIKRFLYLSKYDLIFYLSDGSIPFLSSRKNILHFQVPFNFSPNYFQAFLNRIKLLFVKSVVCNSCFTSKFITKNFTPKNIVLYPPVDVNKFTIAEKEKIILSVGRFDNLLNAKKQDILIESFKLLSPLVPDWKLVLAGGSLQNPLQNSYLNHLRSISKEYPIEFHVNPNFDELKNLYSNASIYWHAAGYDVDQDLHPEATEHFGMVVVEAMSAGLVPLVVNCGGLPEIINNGSNGYLWETVDTLNEQTLKLIKDKKLLNHISLNSKDSSQQFSKAIFSQKLLDIIHL